MLNPKLSRAPATLARSRYRTTGARRFVRRLFVLSAPVIAALSIVSCGHEGSDDGRNHLGNASCTQLCADFRTETEISCRFEAQHCADTLTRKNNLVRTIDKTTSPLEWTGQNSSPVDVFNRSLEQYLSLGCANPTDPPTPTLDPHVDADRCAFLAASAEQQFHTLTLLLAPQR